LTTGIGKVFQVTAVLLNQVISLVISSNSRTKGRVL